MWSFARVVHAFILKATFRYHQRYSATPATQEALCLGGGGVDRRKRGRWRETELDWSGSLAPQTLQQDEDSGGPRRASEGGRKRIKVAWLGGTHIPLLDWDAAGHRMGTGPAWFLTIRRLCWWWWCAEKAAANSCRARHTAPQPRIWAWAAAAGIKASPHHTLTNAKPDSLTEARQPGNRLPCTSAHTPPRLWDETDICRGQRERSFEPSLTSHLTAQVSMCKPRVFWAVQDTRVEKMLARCYRGKLSVWAALCVLVLCWFYIYPVYRLPRDKEIVEEVLRQGEVWKKNQTGIDLYRLVSGSRFCAVVYNHSCCSGFLWVSA